MAGTNSLEAHRHCVRGLAVRASQAVSENSNGVPALCKSGKGDKYILGVTTVAGRMKSLAAVRTQVFQILRTNSCSDVMMWMAVAIDQDSQSCGGAESHSQHTHTSSQAPPCVLWAIRNSEI